ncbi:flagellar hook-length control protein FliK [Azonexus sp. IMCC34842]|uniref:flagellar hook-length control protein FliK n=1 Tax=Azonexus sp. IMCC34842 TaxID=3420950 RepID=UPI003D0AE1E5
MSVTVISSMPSGTNAAVAATGASNATGGDGLPGEFAALLSGELKNLLSQLPGTSEKTLADLEAGQNKTASDSSDTIPDLVDPALIASLTGNAQFQPDISARGNTAFQPTADKTEKSIAGAALATLNGQAGGASSEQETLRAAEKAAAGLFDKLNPTGNNTANANTLLQSGPANIAVETSGLETNATTLTNNLAPLAAGRQAQGTEAAQPQNVSTHLRDASWPQQFGDKIVWLAKNDQQTAQININPPQLGPVQITINLSGDQATLAFASPHAEVRQAIESAMPQLKDLLASAGINLGQANVGANLAQQNPNNPSQPANENRSAGENAILPANDNAPSTGASTVLNRGRGLVDLFA